MKISSIDSNAQADVLPLRKYLELNQMFCPSRDKTTFNLKVKYAKFKKLNNFRTPK